MLRELFPSAIEQFKKRKNRNTSKTPLERLKQSTAEDDDPVLQDNVGNSTFEDYDD